MDVRLDLTDSCCVDQQFFEELDSNNAEKGGVVVLPDHQDLFLVNPEEEVLDRKEEAFYDSVESICSNRDGKPGSSERKKEKKEKHRMKDMWASHARANDRKRSASQASLKRHCDHQRQ